MQSLGRTIGLLVLAALLAAPVLARAASPAGLCRQLGTDDRLHAIPQALVPDSERLFGLHSMPAEWVQRTTFFRCYDGHVFVCNVGANLPCGKANQSRELPGATAWCAKNPDAGFIPMYVTGHDTIYSWRCRASAAVPTAQVFTVGPRGFITQFWKPADP